MESTSARAANCPTGTGFALEVDAGAPLETLIASVGTQGLQQRQAKLTRLLRQAGAHYTQRGSAERSNIQQWCVDPLPVVVTAADWQAVQTGLMQRTRLLNQLLQDIYGEQRLIRDGVIPAALIYRHPGYVRAMQHLLQHQDMPLIIAASDLIRTAQGEFCVVSDRLQAPSGLGYTLQNRRVVSQVSTEPLFQTHTLRLASLFNRFKQALIERSGVPYPKIVILTPGSLSETFYEQKLLANYLGFSLVQGRDLSVDQGKIWFDSDSGRQPVDVIIRRVDQEWCDPVELRGDSLLGIPGLLEVVRCGGVVLANPIGSGVLETPAMLKYLPAVSAYLNSEALQLPTVRTLWGPEDLEQIVEQLPSLVIKPFSRSQPMPASVYGPSLSASQLAQLRQQIIDSPQQFVAQAIVPSAQTPCWQQGELTARGYITRSFTVQTSQGYETLAGGLTRAETRTSKGIVSNQTSAINKDTWVISDHAVASSGADLTPDAPDTALPLFAAQLNENYFWMARYAERSLATLETLNTLAEGIADECLEAAQIGQLLALLDQQTDQVLTEQLAAVDPGESDSGALVPLLLSTRLGSPQANLQSLLFAAETINTQWSPQVQRTLRTLQEQLLQINESLAVPRGDQLLTQTGQLLTLIYALNGTVQDNSADNTSIQLYRAGLLLESALQLLVKLNQTGQQDPDSAQLIALISDHRAPASLTSKVEALNRVLISLDSEQPDSLLASYREPLVEMMRDLLDLRFEEPRTPRNRRQWRALFGRWRGQLQSVAEQIQRSYCGAAMQPHPLNPMGERR